MKQCGKCKQEKVCAEFHKHGLNGPHRCGIAFACRAFLYLAAAADKQRLTSTAA